MIVQRQNSAYGRAGLHLGYDPKSDIYKETNHKKSAERDMHEALFIFFPLADPARPGSGLHLNGMYPSAACPAWMKNAHGRPAYTILVHHRIRNGSF